MTLSWKRVQSRRAASSAGARDCSQIAFVHRGATHFGDRYVGRLRNRIHHHACERALPQIAREEAQQKLLLLRVARANKARNVVARRALEPLPLIAISSSNT